MSIYPPNCSTVIFVSLLFLSTGRTPFLLILSSLVAQKVKNLPAIHKIWIQSLGQEDPLEKEMSTHSSILAWRIPWTEEPGRLQSMGLQRVRHDWASWLSFFKDRKRPQKKWSQGKGLRGNFLQSCYMFNNWPFFPPGSWVQWPPGPLLCVSLVFQFLHDAWIHTCGGWAICPTVGWGQSPGPS